MNRIDRLVAFIIFLQSKKIIRGYEIADHFGISLRTVYRDINALCEAGVPIAAEAGEGYHIVEGYHLPPVMFTTNEAMAIFTSTQLAAQLTDQSVKSNVESALIKIQSVLSDGMKNNLEKLKESIALYTHPVTKIGFKDDILITVQDAIVNCKVLKIEYWANTKNKVTTREIEPLGMVYYAGRWHIIAWCLLRRDLRDFRADSFKSVQKKDEIFKKRDNISLEGYFKNFGKTKKPQEIIIRLNLQAAQSIKDKLYTSVIDEKRAHGKVTFTLLSPGFEWLIPLLLAYRTSVEIITPDALKERLVRTAKDIVKHHSRSFFKNG